MTRPQRSAAERSGRCSAGLREVTWSGPCDKSETLDPCTTPLMKLLPADPRPTTRMCSGLWNPPMLQIASAANHDAPWAHRNVNLKRRSPCRDSRLSPNDISRCGFRRPRFSWSAWHPHQRTRPAHHHHHSHGAPVVAPNQSESGSHRLVRRFAGLLVHWFAGLVRWSGSVVASGRSLEILGISNHQLPIVHSLRPSQTPFLQSSPRQSVACWLLMLSCARPLGHACDELARPSPPGCLPIHSHPQKLLSSELGCPNSRSRRLCTVLLARTAPAALQHCAAAHHASPSPSSSNRAGSGIHSAALSLLIRWRSIWGKAKTGGSQNQIRIVDNKTAKRRPMLVPNMLRRDLRCGARAG